MAISHITATYYTVPRYYQFLEETLVAVVMTYPYPITECHLILVGWYLIIGTRPVVACVASGPVSVCVCVCVCVKRCLGPIPHSSPLTPHPSPLTSSQASPRFAYAHTLLGHEYLILKDFEKALSAFQTAVSLDPRHYNAW